MRQGKIQQNTKQPEMHSIYYIHNVIKVTEKYGKQKCKILIYIYGHPRHTAACNHPSNL